MRSSIGDELTPQRRGVRDHTGRVLQVDRTDLLQVPPHRDAAGGRLRRHAVDEQQEAPRRGGCARFEVSSSLHQHAGYASNCYHGSSSEPAHSRQERGARRARDERQPCSSLSAFLASAVEMVEALTIVLAAGLSRGWRSALTGVGAAHRRARGDRRRARPGARPSIPLDALRLVVGALLLVFGLQWLRKAILRASGYKALHDEDAIFARELEEARGAQARTAARPRLVRLHARRSRASCSRASRSRSSCSPSAARRATSASRRSAPASRSCSSRGVGIAVRAPLSRVPENTMKFAVGIMLTTFGSFWSAEGAGAHWPGGDASLLGVLGVHDRRRRRCSSRCCAASERSPAARCRDGMIAGSPPSAGSGGSSSSATTGASASRSRSRSRATAAVAAAGVSAWWVLPPAVSLVLYASLRRATR